MYRAPDVDKINEILHFTHAIESFEDFFSDLTKDWEKWRPFAGRSRINSDSYLASQDLYNLLHWMRKHNMLCRFLDLRRYYVDEIADLIRDLHSPKIVGTVDGFEQMLATFLSYVAFADKDIKTKSKRLTCVECVRLDEALVCYENYSYYASVIMAVSAVESRIIELIRRADSQLYESNFSESTFGQLISIFDPGKFIDDKYKQIKGLIPDKHRPLLALLNQHRVFSVHPSEEVISAQIADSIMHLSFAFMLDESTCPYTEDELMHG